MITEAVASVAGDNAPLHTPEISGNEWEYVKDCLDTEWVSTVGSYVNRFEEALTEITGAKFAIATSSGTSALHACLIVAGVGREDEVIVPALTFVATANAVAYQGATPHFVDCELTTLGIDAAKLDQHLSDTAELTGDGCRNRKTGRSIRALICMHTFGHPCDLDGLKALCDRWRLVLIEDAAESIGSYYKGQHTGNTGVLSALSFNGNKIITTGGGGAVLTNDEDLARRIKHITTTAKTPHAWEFVHDEIGYNYRLPNVNAAIGCAQLEKLPEWLHQKRALAAKYRDVMKELAGISYFDEPAECVSNYWLNVVMLDEDKIELRDVILEALNGAGLMSRPAWTPMHMLEMFGKCPRGDLSTAESVFRRLINIPSSPRLA